MLRGWLGALSATVLLVLLVGCRGSGAAVEATPDRRAGQATTPAAPPAPSAPAAPASPARADAPSPVRLGYLAAMSHAPFFLAIEKGYFRELALDVEATEFRGTDVAMPFLANGQLDVVGGAVAAGFLNALHQGVSGRIVAMISGAGPDGFLPSALVVSKENYDAGRFTTPAQLLGRRLAVTGKGSYGEFVADRAMRKGGLTLEDVELVIMGFPDMLPGLASGAIDAASLTEPWVLYAQERGIGAIIVREGLDPNSTAQVVLYGEQFVKNNPEGARRFMVGYLRALRDLARSRYQDPTEAAIVEQYTKVPADVIMRAVPAQVDVNGRMNIDHLMLQQQFYMERGYLNYREPLDLQRFVDYTWLDYAIQQLGPYRP